LDIVSWNVNGIRAAAKKGLLEYMTYRNADIYCFQEIKAYPGQLPPAIRTIEPWHAYFHPAQRKGYSGTAIYTKQQPRSIRVGMGNHRFDSEGRIMMLDYGDILLYNGYFPNGTARKERLQFKLDFYDFFLDHLNSQLARGKEIIICGDVNTAHKEIDLARPAENSNTSGFLPEERKWIDNLLAAGFIDTFRLFDKSPEKYTWWDMKTRARDRNVGWRIDYFFASEGLKKRLTAAGIESEQQGSDHCPVSLAITDS
jgi:exodeoxyribonuclease-3